MGDMGPRGAINMGGRDLKQKGFCNLLAILWELYMLFVVSAYQ